MSAYKSSTETAAAIRAEFKAKGWGAKHVSVTAQSFSMGSSVRVKVKDAAVDYGQAKAIAASHERISRCAITGDILSGGNLYISVSMSSECREQLAAKHLPAVRAALAQLTGDSSTLLPVSDRVMLGRDGWTASLWSRGPSYGGMRSQYSADDALSIAVGVALAEAGVDGRE